MRIHAASLPIAAQLCELSSQTCRQWLPELRPSVGITVDRHSTIYLMYEAGLGKEIFGKQSNGYWFGEVYTLVPANENEGYDFFLSFRATSEAELAQLCITSYQQRRKAVRSLPGSYLCSLIGRGYMRARAVRSINS